MTKTEFDDLVKYLNTTHICSFTDLKGTNLSSYDIGNAQEDRWVSVFNQINPFGYNAITTRDLCRYVLKMPYDTLIDGVCGDISIFRGNDLIMRIDLKVGTNNEYYGPISAASIYMFGSPEIVLYNQNMRSRYENYYLCTNLNGNNMVCISAAKIYGYMINQTADSDIKFRESQTRANENYTGIDLTKLFNNNSYVNHIDEHDFLGTLELKKLRQLLVPQYNF